LFFRHAKATGTDLKTSQWEFDFESGKPTKVMKHFKWEALPKDEVPQVYHVNHIKRLRSSAQNAGFEGQLPKLRYYHHIKKVDPQEEEALNKPVSIKTQPITASAKKNGSAGQMKITGKNENVLQNQLFLIEFFFADFLKEKKRLTVTTRKKQR
jgi:hypothetical protein